MVVWGLCAGDGAAQEAPAPPAANAPPAVSAYEHEQAGPFRVLDLSLSLLASVGGSSEPDAVLRELQGGAHDPRARGFTLQQAELGVAGEVEGWLEAQVRIVTAIDTEDGGTLVELEEAFAQTTRLPARLQVRVGTYLTEFGRLNATHAHAWDWLDQPVIATRVLGGDGMRGPGARLSCLLPTELPLELLVGVQNANGEGMPSFLANDEVYAERPIGGRQFTTRGVRSGGDLVWSGRVSTSFALSGATTATLGASAAFGPNATGPDADTLLWGADFALCWRSAPSCGGGSGFALQGEYMARAFTAAAQTDASDPLAPVSLPRTTLADFGGWLQGLYSFDASWSAGLRLELATGDGESYVGGGSFARAEDAFRDDRVRISPLLQWRSSEAARVRLQYDYDDADHLGHAAHSVWLGFEVLLGAHARHDH